MSSCWGRRGADGGSDGGPAGAGGPVREPGGAQNRGGGSMMAQSQSENVRLGEETGRAWSCWTRRGCPAGWSTAR